MKSKKLLAGVAALVMTVAVPLEAQRGSGPGRPGFGAGIGGGVGLGRLSAELNLTEAQKSAIKGINDQARTLSEPIHTSMQAIREQLEAAVKANKTDREIEQITAQQGSLLGQLAAIQAKAARSVWAQLTVEQRAKAEELRSQRPGRGERPPRVGPNGAN